jgi:hypothetical protein
MKGRDAIQEWFESVLPRVASIRIMFSLLGISWLMGRIDSEEHQRPLEDSVRHLELRSLIAEVRSGLT